MVAAFFSAVAATSSTDAASSVMVLAFDAVADSIDVDLWAGSATA